jgi:hypothetical protein
VDLSKLDPGPGRVRSPWECAPTPSASASAAASAAAPSTSTSTPPATTGATFDAREDRFAYWTPNEVIVRSAKDGAIVWRGPGTRPVFRDDGAQVAIFEPSALVVRAMPSGAEVYRAPRAPDAVATAWSDDGRAILAVFDAATPPAAVTYDVNDRKQCRASWTGAFAPTQVFVVSPDRTRALVAADPLAIVYLVKGAREERIAISGRADAQYAFSRSSLVLAGAGSDGVFTWDARTGKRDTSLDTSAATAVALNDNGVYVAAIVADKVRVWDSRSSKLVREFAVTARAITFYPAKTRLVVVTDSGAEAYDVTNGARLWSAH